IGETLNSVREYASSHGHGVTTNNPVLGHTSIAPRVATSKLIFCTIPALNPPQRSAHRNELGLRGALGKPQERSERGVGYRTFGATLNGCRRNRLHDLRLRYCQKLCTGRRRILC